MFCVKNTIEGEKKIFAECAGISALTNDQREVIHEMVNRLVLPQNEILGVTMIFDYVWTSGM